MPQLLGSTAMEGIERINELEDSILEITQCKQTTESRLKKEISRGSLRSLWEYNKRSKIFVLERKRERGQC